MKYCISFPPLFLKGTTSIAIKSEERKSLFGLTRTFICYKRVSNLPLSWQLSANITQTQINSSFVEVLFLAVDEYAFSVGLKNNYILHRCVCVIE